MKEASLTTAVQGYITVAVNMQEKLLASVLTVSLTQQPNRVYTTRLLTCLFWKNKGRELKQMLYSTFQLSSGGLRGERPILGWKTHQARGLTDLSDKLLISALLEQMNDLRLD